MRVPVVQLDRYGCGVACVAYVLGVKYEEARELFIPERIACAKTYCFDITRALAKKDLIFKYEKVHDKNIHLLNRDRTIVFVRKNEKIYPKGHYLVRIGELWMDPWLNRHETDDVCQATSGFREDLRDEPAWVIYQINL